MPWVPVATLKHSVSQSHCQKHSFYIYVIFPYHIMRLHFYARQADVFGVPTYWFRDRELTTLNNRFFSAALHFTVIHNGINWAISCSMLNSYNKAVETISIKY